MPTGPQGQKRPRDTVRCAIMVAKISTGEIEEELQEVAKKAQSGTTKRKAKGKLNAIAKKEAKE